MNFNKPKTCRIAVLLIISVLTCALFSGCAKDKSSELTKIKVSEVTHSVFYAPQYVAMSQGFFEEEGILVELISGEGADKVMTSVVSGAVDIGFSGPEAAIYIYNEGRNDYAKVFAQVTQRDGSFLVAREPDESFTWDKLRGAHLLPGRKGGVPYMALEYVVKNAGFVPGVDVNFDNSIQFAAMAGAFLGGTGDFVTVFEPTASSIEAEGKGYIVASVGAAAGEIPYTAYYALDSFIKKNPEIIQGFTNAIAKAEKWVAEHTASEIANSVRSAFHDTDIKLLTSAIENYKAIDAYSGTPVMTGDAFNRLQTVMKEAGELSQTAPYADIVDNSFAEKAVAGLKY